MSRVRRSLVRAVPGFVLLCGGAWDGIYLEHTLFDLGHTPLWFQLLSAAGILSGVLLGIAGLRVLAQPDPAKSDAP